MSTTTSVYGFMHYGGRCEVELERTARGSAWREILIAGLVPPAYRSQARSASPRIGYRAHQAKPMRTCTQATIATIDALLRERRRSLGDITNI